VSVEWDPANARANFKKHGVSFADAASVLDDDRAMRDPYSEAEERWITFSPAERQIYQGQT